MAIEVRRALSPQSTFALVGLTYTLGCLGPTRTGDAPQYNQVRCQLGDAIADDMEEDLTGPNATMCVGELETGLNAEGTHDSNTLLIDTEDHNYSTGETSTIVSEEEAAIEQQ